MHNIFRQYKGLKKETYILFIGRIVTCMGSFVWPMLTFLLTTRLGISDAIAAALSATAVLVSLPASLIGGRLADKYSRKKIIIIFDFITVALYFVAAALPIGYHTAAIIYIAGISQTLEGPAYDGLTADFSPIEERERAFSLLYLGINLGMVVGSAISGLLFKNYMWLGFVINAISILTSTMLIWRFIFPENAVGAQEDSGYVLGEYEKPVDKSIPILRVLKERRVIAYFILIGCVSSMATGVLGTILPLQLNAGLGYDGAKIYGFLNSLNCATVIIFAPIFTALLVKIKELPKCAIGMILFVIGMVLFAQGVNLWPLFIGMFIYTLGEVISVLGHDPYNSKRIPESHRGRISGVSGIIYTIFAALTQYLTSYILYATTSNYRLIWIIFSIVGVASAILYLAIYRLDKKTFPALFEQKKSEQHK